MATSFRPQSPDLNSLPSTYDDNPYQSSRFGNQFTSPTTYQSTSTPTSYTQPLTHTYEMPATKTEASDPTLGVVLKTSFPVARIKRIMQADEDIGKVAQVTPHVVSRALELFMIKLITSASEQARGPGGSAKGPRRVLAQHMKRAIQADETFDFLAEIIGKVPDAPVKSSKKEAGSDSEDAKPKKRARKKNDTTE